jgi:hypothetical protein
MASERVRELWKKASQKYRDNDPERANGIAKKYRDSHPKNSEKKEEARQTSAIWRKDFKELDPMGYKVYMRRVRIAARYGLTLEQSDAKLTSQNNLCGLCHRPFDLSRKRTSPVLDHDHSTGKNRDFVHSNCNVAIGLLQDDPAMCRLAAEYLERHKSGRVYEQTERTTILQ